MTVEPAKKAGKQLLVNSKRDPRKREIKIASEPYQKIKCHKFQQKEIIYDSPIAELVVHARTHVRRLLGILLSVTPGARFFAGLMEPR